ncbi:putative RTX toxins and related Ca2+-binding protein [Vibrio nigripulchritudo SFn27]|uniref:Putative RTX toxins and related Ca2+-binding protein n=1 Tax=Vibrio nigripulchritudo TaxID=28173 RepID=U4K8X1_9VIBR|nr:hypothetical protein [Vibrio nigripulchritudo]CCN35151.1 putative RTX toxins and related Ca2+-binding protein [Vibrio nigripulchritudo AM115]CCN40971.1 putative RTX toxins and related Ca2+-binding protein [Vibrio nigripulchritudo FTn2]CCN63077.1 putative RTX toxins and related Ca2+-binding protein [Vibrio nigripulchritudo POn4]CCN75613.1 putative RTX toxins and related Ca2+-binding protein [Vibrio nigripulchritudo SO65]CCN81721.1 putative RTX toxins and related Ca2+-binding protein [Vibrio 
MTISLLVGTTNIDGTGSAADLTAENATQAIEGAGSSHDVWGVDLINFMGHEGNSSHEEFNTVQASVVSWGKKGYKEAKVEGDVDGVFLANFVDVHVSLDNESGSYVSIENAKRGYVETSSGDDDVFITVRSNNNLWSNHFDVKTGEGNDRISMWDAGGSQYTSLNIDAGSGHDIVDISRLRDADPGVTRIVDGGEGFDVYVKGGSHTSVDFKNFEVIEVNYADDFHVELTLEDLSKNGQGEHGLIIDAATFNIEDADRMEKSALTDSDKLYLHDHGYSSEAFVKVDVFDDFSIPDSHYTIFVYDDILA